MKSEDGVNYLTLEAAKNASSACVCLFKWT